MTGMRRGASIGSAALVSASVVGVLFANVSVAAVRTTTPGNSILVEVNITDQGIRTAMLRISTFNGNKTYVAAYSAQRGQIAYFVVSNRGKRPHNFVLLGKKTSAIRPGAVAHLQFALLIRGAFRYQSTLDAGKKQFSGTFTVT
jgi:hypothetical protein